MICFASGREIYAIAGVEILKKSCRTTSPSGFSEPIISHLKATGLQPKAAGPMEKLPAKTGGPAVISTPAIDSGGGGEVVP